MNEYLVYTSEGETIAPNSYINVENCQILGRAEGSSLKNAIDNLFDEHPWIEVSGYGKSKCLGVQILSNAQREDISTVVDYLWKDESSHYQECNCVRNHIFSVIRRLSDIVK